MITTERKIDLLVELGNFLQENNTEMQEVKFKAAQANAWFTEAHINLAINNITTQFLQKNKLITWMKHYKPTHTPQKVGIVMAGNIPLVGFHDFLCGFMSGHKLLLKLSTKDEVLLTYIIKLLIIWEPEIAEYVQIADRLNGCDAYIATGSNNTARYFEQYFGKQPHIIRKNRTSVAIIDGAESEAELLALGEDVYFYYGLGCRNVSQICVPKEYDFVPLLNTFNKYNYYADLNKYKNNYDYHLAIYLLNRVPYMSNESLLLVENALPFSAVSVLHYRYYDDKNALLYELKQSTDIQTIIGDGFTPFGESQQPALNDYPDGVDTMEFLINL